jgi:hypothetical protein
MKFKDVQLRDLQLDLKKMKELKTIPSGIIASQNELKYQQQIAALKEEVRAKNRALQMLQSNKGVTSLADSAKLQKEMERKEKDFLSSIQKYSSGLEALKSQVSLENVLFSGYD